MTDFKPGTVAMVRLKGDQCLTQRAWLDSLGCWQFADGYSVHSSRPDLIADVRPLVVLDPDDAEQMEQLGDAYHAVDGLELDNEQPMSMRGLAMRHALRDRILPPKPAEPLGLGAVVEDAEGRKWVRKGTTAHGEDWSYQIGDAWTGNPWSRIDAVRVLSDGVTA